MVRAVINQIQSNEHNSIDHTCQSTRAVTCMHEYNVLNLERAYLLPCWLLNWMGRWPPCIHGCLSEKTNTTTPSGPWLISHLSHSYWFASFETVLGILQKTTSIHFVARAVAELQPTTWGQMGWNCELKARSYIYIYMEFNVVFWTMLYMEFNIGLKRLVVHMLYMELLAE